MKTGRYLLAVIVVAAITGATLPASADNPPANPPAVQPPKQSAPKTLSIEIVSAFYGHSTMRTSCEVTPLVKRSCNGRSRCVVKVEDELCPPPKVLPPGLILTLTVDYKCTPLVTGHTITADKPFQIVIDCGGAGAQFSPKIGSAP
jgi:hypothetical protein